MSLEGKTPIRGHDILEKIASKSPEFSGGRIWKKAFSSRISEARKTVSQAITKHSIELADPRGAFEFTSWTACVSTTTLTDFTYASESDLNISVSADERDCYFIIIPITGKGSVRVDDRIMPMIPGTALIFGPTGSVDFIDSPPKWRNLDIRLNRQRFEDYVARQKRSILYTNIEFEQRPISLLGEGNALLRFVHFLLNECASHHPIFENGDIARSVEESLFGVILESMAFVDRTSLASEAQHKLNRLSKLVLHAERFINANFAEDLDIKTIAEAVNAKPRSLHNAFKTYRDYTPLQLVRARRLDHARDVLSKSHPHETSVTKIALDSGFMHLSKFAAAYKRRFGESPRITLRMAPDS